MNLRTELFGSFPGARFIGKEEREEVLAVIAARSPYRFHGLNLLKKTKALETVCCKLFERKYSLAVSSGTAALHTALFSMGVTKGNEVILPAYAWSANLMTTLALRAVPVIAPIDDTLGLEVSSIASCITKRTKVVIAVHMRGYPCDLKGIINLCKKYRIGVLEDGAQCLGGSIGGKAVGSMGNVSILSFQYNKLLTSGEGGALLTDDPKVYKRAYQFHDLGMFRRAGEPDPEGRGAIRTFGLNYRLSELQAAFLLAQLNKMPLILEALRKTRERAKKTLEPICGKFGLVERRLPSDAKPNGAFLCLIAESRRGAARAWRELRKRGVPVGKCSQRNPHHFMVWRKFMDSSGFDYRASELGRSAGFLERSLLLELNPLPSCGIKSKSSHSMK